MVLTVTAEEYKLLSSFEEIRKTLLEEQYADRLDRPLAYWALPNDRRLPLAFLGRSLRELLQTPFDALSATPGIGQKKIASLVRLLQRAAADSPGNRTEGPQINGFAEDVASETDLEFEPATLSEGAWELWREAVRRHRLGHEKLGRLAGSLQNLPTVIWHTPLYTYLDYSLAEVRQLKTHGEKRIRAVLEVFYEVHRVVGALPANPRLSICLRPAFISPIEEWIGRLLVDSRHFVGDLGEEVERHLSVPLLQQIQLDSGPTVRDLVQGRLGLDGQVQSVRMQSRKMGVTRARIYQLLDDCAKVAEVRWPEGKLQLSALAEELANSRASSKATEQVATLRELLFPEKYNVLDETGLPADEGE
jgi:hypothetical protein